MRNVALLGKQEMKGCKTGTSQAEGTAKDAAAWRYLQQPQWHVGQDHGAWSLTKGYWKPSSQGDEHRAIPFTQHWDQLPCSSVERHPALCAGRIRWRGSAEEEGPDLSISFQVHRDSLRKMRGNASRWLPLSCPAALPAQVALQPICKGRCCLWTSLPLPRE